MSSQEKDQELVSSRSVQLSHHSPLSPPIRQPSPSHTDHHIPTLSVDNANSRPGRSRASSVHSSTSSHGVNVSPIRPSPGSMSTSQRLRTPSVSNNCASSKRRASLSGFRDASEFSSSIGMPYSYSLNQNSGTTLKPACVNPQYSLAGAGLRMGSDLSSMRQCTSNGSSPRSSFSTYDAIRTDCGSRRYSEQTPRKPSMEEVFDLMEREQDAIVLKLMREISQLKEENRALLNTVNQLTSNASTYPLRSVSQSRTSVNSRRNSSAIIDDTDLAGIQQPSSKSVERKIEIETSINKNSKNTGAHS